MWKQISISKQVKKKNQQDYVTWEKLTNALEFLNILWY